MKNRAKCKLCSSIIESFHASDSVQCSCGEIFVDGGDGMLCGAVHFENFLRIDDEGNEIPVKYEKKEAPTKVELLDMLDEMIKNIEGLPSQAMSLPINHYDFVSALLLISSTLKA